MKYYPWFAGAWAAVLWFFTAGVAIPLFRIFPNNQAGPIAVAIFPYYFSAAIILGVLATITLWVGRQKSKRVTFALALQILAVLALLAIPTILQPAMAPHPPGSPAFMRLHGVSSLLNLFSLIVAPAAFLLVTAKRKEELV